jgi:hypothetical protein
MKQLYEQGDCQQANTMVILALQTLSSSQGGDSLSIMLTNLGYAALFEIMQKRIPVNLFY